MSHLVSRILLAIFVFPFGAIFYLMLLFVLEEGIISTSPYSYTPDREVLCFLICGGVTWIAVAIYWWLLWRSSVVWNINRFGGTFVAAFAAAIAGAIVGATSFTFLIRGRGASFGTFIGSVVAILLWLIATIFLWRETRAERGKRVAGAGNAITCPACGYNLTGLNDARCPECGSKFTLNELFASQPSTAAAADIA